MEANSNSVKRAGSRPPERRGVKLRQYAIKANVTFLVSAIDLEASLDNAKKLLPDDTVILDLQSWPIDNTEPNEYAKGEQ